ncbi:MAG: hypothetical protein Kow00129_14460 [Thermoleophilia bacterium]
MPCPEMQHRVLRYLSEAHVRNPEAEVPGQELAQELSLSLEDVRSCVLYLVAEGLATAEVFPLNIWVRITEQGLRLAQDHG